MYIDTHTKESMEKSVCDYLKVGKDELKELFEEVWKNSADEYEMNKKIFDFIAEHKNGKVIDEILFFHFARRLNEDNDYTGYNLYDVLTKDTALSRFLKKYDIAFKIKEECLELFYNGKLETFENIRDDLYFGIQKRMGYGSHKEYCFNGLAFRSEIMQNYYKDHLRNGPEFLSWLFQAIKREDIYIKYQSSSIYYLFEYKVPLNKVIFTTESELSLNEKKDQIVFEVLNYLYSYNKSIVNAQDNPHLRLKDDDVMEAKYLIKKEIVNNRI